MREQTAELANIALADGGMGTSPRTPFATRALLDDGDVPGLRLSRPILTGAHSRDLYEAAGSYQRPPAVQPASLLRVNPGNGAASLHSTEVSERDPLLPKQNGAAAGEPPNGVHHESREDVESQCRHQPSGGVLLWAKYGGGLRRPQISARDVWEKGVVEPVSFLPAVVLGLLLNVLDGLSYGMWCLVSLED